MLEDEDEGELERHDLPVDGGELAVVVALPLVVTLSLKITGLYIRRKGYNDIAHRHS